jgi:hypothetical protein
LTPPPQHCEQLLQDDHGEILQLVVQGFRWHGLTKEAAPHTSSEPPWTVRILEVDPQPQVSEHKDQLLQSPTLQVAGHVLTEHCFVSSTFPHALPPDEAD